MGGGGMRGRVTCVTGHAWWGACMTEGRKCGGGGGGVRGRRDGHCSGWYASY